MVCECVCVWGGGCMGDPMDIKYRLDADLYSHCLYQWTCLIFVTYGDLEILVLSMLWWASEDYCISSAIDFPVLDYPNLQYIFLTRIVHHTWTGSSCASSINLWIMTLLKNIISWNLWQNQIILRQYNFSKEMFVDEFLELFGVRTF